MIIPKFICQKDALMDVRYMKIIIADEKRPSRVLLDNILELEDHEVIQAKDGTEAIKLYDNNPDTDMIFVSWDLPTIDSGELARTIKEKGSDSKPYIFFTTERETEKTLMDALEAGADDIIFKPFMEEVVLSRVERGVEEMKDVRIKGDFDPIEDLLDEHCFIQRVVNTVQIVSSKMHDTVPKNILEWINDTSLIMERQVHHKKEMHFLVGFLEKAIREHGEAPSNKLFSRAALKSVEEEHKELESKFKVMQKEITTHLEGISNVEDIRIAIDDYAVLLRKHIRREERFLFPMSRRYIDEELKKQMRGDFLAVEEKAGIEKLEKMKSRLSRVEDVLDIKRPKG